MTETRHATPTRRRSRLLDATIYTVVGVLVFGGIGYTLGQRDQATAPAAVTTPALIDGAPVVAGDGRLYYFRGYHVPAQFQERHSLVSVTRTGAAIIAPGLSVRPAS